MSPERSNLTLREIKFGGEGIAESIRRGFAITTLRLPKPDYRFSRGEKILADCFDDHEKVPVMVITNVTERLRNFTIPQLALDGYFSASMAVNDLKNIPGYEKTNRNSELQAITFVKKESCRTIPKSLKDELIYRKFDELVRMPALRHLFFPTMCIHFTNYGGVKDWIEFLSVNKLISVQEKLNMKNYETGGENIAQFLQDNPEIFRKLPLDPLASLFRPMILGLFDIK